MRKLLIMIISVFSISLFLVACTDGVEKIENNKQQITILNNQENDNIDVLDNSQTNDVINDVNKNEYTNESNGMIIDNGEDALEIIIDDEEY